VIASDHGEELKDRSAIGHHMSLHTEVNRIVMLFHAPQLGIEAGKSEREVSGIDLAPTLMELLGSVMDKDLAGQDLDGISMAPFMLTGMDQSVLDQRASSLEGRALIGHREGSRKGNLYCVVKGRWKLIRKLGKDYLYDLENDPLELRNVRSKEQRHYRELLAELERYEARDFQLEEDLSEIEFDEELRGKLDALGYTED
jgi:arylsulfatase A-like enzyme